MISKSVVALVCIISAGLVTGFSGGAPRIACNSLKPRHAFYSEQRSGSPYVLVLSATTVRSRRSATLNESIDTSANPSLKARSANGVQVTLFSPAGEEFAGYIVQARSDDTLVGSFSGDGKVLDCQGTQATITHNVRGAKRSVSLFWIPPSNFQGDVVFLATVVKSFSRYWTGIESAPLSVV